MRQITRSCNVGTRNPLGGRELFEHIEIGQHGAQFGTERFASALLVAAGLQQALVGGHATCCGEQ
jgi:hypothetical protein